mmetsp:Transcript_25233/g.69438  ORF Transcript_25233/g.69438 Transcript_25233/m.69438 type:complete len:416 (+) Transcript_25233:729-1976(+)
MLMGRVRLSPPSPPLLLPSCYSCCLRGAHLRLPFLHAPVPAHLHLLHDALRILVLFTTSHAVTYLSPLFRSPFRSLGNIGCAPPFAHGNCRTWIKATHTSVRTHEFGHNYGLSHAGTATLEYGDSSSVMGAPYKLMDYNAPSRIQLGWLADTYIHQYESPISPPPPPPSPPTCPYVGACPNYYGCHSGAQCQCTSYCWYDSSCCLAMPPPPPAPPLAFPANRVELRSLYLNPKVSMVGDASAIRAKCPGCISHTPGYDDGGNFIVSYRTPHGYDAQMASKFHNTVSVHLQRNWNAGTELYAYLAEGEQYEDPTGFVVHVCRTFEFYALVAIATSVSDVDCSQSPPPSSPSPPPSTPPLRPPTSPPFPKPPPPPNPSPPSPFLPPAPFQPPNLPSPPSPPPNARDALVAGILGSCR